MQTGNTFFKANGKTQTKVTSLQHLAHLAKALKQNYPDLVANYYRWDGITSNVSKGDKSFREDIADWRQHIVEYVWVSIALWKCSNCFT